ncbi:MAG TPA: HlyD family efflux transporter periplasmic adaptor subunit [Anaerolineales bacterium]|jgi:HlyD family secretion protein|nr:HlyD family efflux transporter periplasmic adaptor subunit [Anaerolineales bacterium]
MKHKFFIMLISLALLFTACSPAATATSEVIPTVIADSTIIAEGRAEPVRDAEIAFSTSGLVSEVLAEEGQTVKKGELLIRLGGESDSNYAAAQYEVAGAQKALNDLIKDSQADFAQAVIDLKQAEEDLEKAEVYLHYLKTSKKVPQPETFVYYIKRGKGYDVRLRTHHYRGPAPAGWITKAEEDVALKKATMEKLQNTVNRMKENGVDTEQLAVAEAELEAAKAKVAAFEITAPFDGVVAEMNAKAGSSIRPGEVAVVVADFSNWLVKTTDLTEIDVVELTEGDPVVVKLDALPDLDLKGTILSIGQTFLENQGDVVYEVTVQLTDTPPAIRWGMTASVTFENEE